MITLLLVVKTLAAVAVVHSAQSALSESSTRATAGRNIVPCLFEAPLGRL
jgi:hypothetical protein